MELFWYFIAYSFLGFLLEVAFARGIRAEKRDRKCFLMLPLCPVYGLGALAIVLLPEWVRRSVPLLILTGGVAATAVEYVMALLYEKGMGVAFWDYSQLRFNIRGRVCLLFSLFWGVLAWGLVTWVHPWIALVVNRMPLPLTVSVMLLLAADSVSTVTLLRRTGSTQSLRWYLRG